MKMLAALAFLTLATPASAQLTTQERSIAQAVIRDAERNVALLQRLVNRNSGTLNLDGVRAVGEMVRAELEPELAGDPMLGQVGWSWLVDALDQRGVDYANEAGTVTRVVSESFAGLADREPSVEMEVRASWTPQVGAGLGSLGPARPEELGAHLLAWSDLLCTVAGLPPLPEGVVALPGQRR